MFEGRLAELWRYPVKSMLGEQLQECDVGPGGLIGDRAYALIDRETGKVASAKNPRRWPDLFRYAAAFIEPPQSGRPSPPAQITLPDGSAVRTDSPSAEGVLSRALGREVALATRPPEGAVLEEEVPAIEGVATAAFVRDDRVGATAPGTFFDVAPLHLLTTATLAALAREHPAGRFEPARFRPNLLIAGARNEPRLEENEWIGRNVSLGAEVTLTVALACPRCVMITLAQGDLPPDSNILRSVAKRNTIAIMEGGPAMPSAGVYAMVAAPGAIRVGDRIIVG